MSNIINLLKLNYTNLKAIKNTVLLSCVLFTIAGIANPMFLSMLPGLIVFNMTYQTIAYEDMHGIDNLIGYLPVTRNEYVMSKYIGIIINMMVGIVAFSLCYFIGKYILGSGENLLPYDLMISISIVSSVCGICAIIPCILKMGMVKGRMIGTVLMILAMMVPSLLISLAEETDIAMTIMIKLSNIGIPMISSGISVVVLVLSYVISLKIYENKEIL